MLIRRTYVRLSIALVFTSVMLLWSSAYGQASVTKPGGPDKEVAGTLETRADTAEIKVVTPLTKTSDLERDLAAMKADNATVREQLRRMEDQQKALLELVERLQQRLDGGAAAAGSGAPLSLDLTQPANAASPSTTAAVGPAAPPADASAPAPPVPIQATPKDDERYQQGIIIWKTPDDAKVPFLLNFNNVTQVRYLNTLSSKKTFTDHLGVVRDVNTRNDITVNRSMFTLSGYIFDKRLQYSLLVWTSAGAASIIVAGSVGWRFNKHFTLTGGYTGAPGSRSLVNTFPYFTASDRSMADNFFRPGFTQGVWATGELSKRLYYQGFVGNGLNTLNISATKIDTKLLLSGSVWWEPLGNYAPPGRTINMYDDYFAAKKVRIRLGTAFTRSPEDRFSNIDQSSPDNTAIYNSDGINAFATGAFAPGVTLSNALYKMWAIDGGIKYNGLAINGQYYMRWLSNFVADGPIPETSTFDHGYELSASYFVKPKKLALFVRGSQIFGQFGNSYEYAGGVKWYFLPTERLWLQPEVMRVSKAPYSGAFSPYTAGLNGWVPMVQTIIAF